MTRYAASPPYKLPSRVFYRDAKRESRFHCPCGLCRLRFGLRRCAFEDRKARQDMGRWRRFRSQRAIKGHLRWLAEVKRLEPPPP